MQPFSQWLNRTKAGPKPKRRLPKMSSKRQREAKAYSLLRSAYMKAHPKCEVWFPTSFGIINIPVCEGASTDVHHKSGRLGGNYLNTDTWLSTCRSCHSWIHAHPSEARKLGLLQ